MAAHTSWASTPDRSARTAAARAAFMARFEDQVDPEHRLDPAERAKRAENARRAHFLRLALTSVDTRRRKSEAAQLRSLADQLDNPGGETP